MPTQYRDDLAFIHDAGFGHFARHAAPVLLERLQRAGLTGGLVIDLGCGSGILTQHVTDAGYDALGVDLSPAMIALARERAPTGRFHVGSCLTAELPECVAVAAVGECFNYLFDRGNTSAALVRLFRRIARALVPGGLLLFDVAGPGRIPGGRKQGYREGDDWTVLWTTEESAERMRLKRDIITFRKVGELYRRDHEVHEQRLLSRVEVTRQLRAAGFRVASLRGYGPLAFGPGHYGFVARKP